MLQNNSYVDFLFKAKTCQLFINRETYCSHVGWRSDQSDTCLYLKPRFGNLLDFVLIVNVNVIAISLYIGIVLCVIMRFLLLEKHYCCI